MTAVEPFIPYSWGPWLMGLVILGMFYALIITFKEDGDDDCL
jgi:hypothetical protein